MKKPCNAAKFEASKKAVLFLKKELLSSAF
jgi:hypothetical protein